MAVLESDPESNSPFTVVRMDPSEILSLAGQFVVQYYTVMAKCPSGLHRFYKDDSAMIREDAPVFGQRMIHDKIMNLNLQDSRVAILRLDALRASGNSVLIQVAGEISKNEETFRRFTQSFILREQTPCDFYVLNDIFRYQDHVYGDVQNNESKPNGPLTPKSAVDFTAGDCGPHSIPHPPEPEGLDHMSSWDNATSENVYKCSGEIETNENEFDGSDVNQLVEHPRAAHTPVHSPCPQNMGNAQIPDNSQQNTITSTQNPSWAQMASKPPSQAVLNMHTNKNTRNNPHISDYQNSEEHPKANTRQPAGASQFPQRGRGAGGRSQQSDGRVASGDSGFGQDNRGSSQGPVRSNMGRFPPSGVLMRGGSRGPRGGMGNGSTGRGAGNMAQRRA